MKIKLETENQAIWPCTQDCTHSFLQSDIWASFNQKQGKKCVIVDFESHDSASHAFGFVQKIGFGISYVYFPRFPVNHEKTIQEILVFLRENNFAFARFEPVDSFDSFKQIQLKKVQAKQPEHTLLLDITPDFSSLFASMHSKTRYNIRLAQKKGVTVSWDKNSAAFWSLMRETGIRDGFKPHSRSYYELFLSLPAVHQATAWLEDIPLASYLFFHHHNTFVYVHGSSSNKNRNLMAPYLLQYEGIKRAKDLGCSIYDFWGIAPSVSSGVEDAVCKNGYCWSKKHKFNGITSFKIGFGGTPVSYGGAYEIVTHEKKYALYKKMTWVRGMVGKIFGK